MKRSAFSFFKTYISIFLCSILFVSSYSQSNGPCDSVKWEDGAHWNTDGSIDDAPNSPFPGAIVRCGSSAETESNIMPNSTYDPNVFTLPSGHVCIDPSTGLPEEEEVSPGVFQPVITNAPEVGQEVTWFQFDVREFAGSSSFQVISNDNIAWALYYSNNPGKTYGPAPYYQTGDCNDLTYATCGTSFTGWANTPFETPIFGEPTNYYLVIWDRDDNASTTNGFSFNFKARFGCGDDSDFTFCNLETQEPTTTCNTDGTYTVEVPIVGANAEYVGFDPNATPTTSAAVCLTNLGDTNPVTSGTITMTYPQSVSSYNISISAQSPPGGTCADPDNPLDCVAIATGTAPVCCDPPTVTANITDITCFGENDGTITVNTSGGSGTFTYSLDGGTTSQSSNVFSGLSSGTYTVTVIVDGDLNCIATTAQLTIAEPADIVLTTSFTDVTCHGAADGSITASATGGATITVDGAAYDPAATYAPGDYLVRAEAAGNEGATCFEEVTITIAQPADIVLTTSFTDVTCHGAADGSITASATGGATITVDGAAYDPAATYAPGDYLVRAEAAGNEGATCFEEVTITIAQPADIVLTTSFTDVTCHGAADGSITASATGGATITVDGAAYDPAATYAPGDYLVRAEAAGNEGATCFEEVTITIAQPADIVLTTSFTDVTCHGAADGSITASATGGATITVDGAAYDPAATYAPGDYLVRAEAAGNEGATCFEEVTITIAQPADIVLTTSFTDVTCHGAADGSITASATGGATITVDGAAYDPAATYAPGDYLVRAEAAGNEGATCFEEVTITIAQPADIVLTTSFTDVTCHGAADGSITASATGGATITVDGAAYDPAATYAPGDYLVRAEAAGNEGATCFEEVTITIAQPADIVLTTSFTDVTCHGAADGSITASATGGATITVDGAAYDPAATYAPGDYLVRAEAAGNEGATCFEEVTITIAQPADIVLTTSFTDVTCHGAADGSITASATGGATITVDGAAYDPAATYAPGDYLVRAEAAGNEGATCFEEVTITIAQPADIVLTTSFTDVTCHGAADGSITASATGGATITVDGAAYDPAATYAPGDYLVRAEAAGNEGATCFEEVTITIAQPADIVLTTSFTDVTCHGAADGSITASATGGATITVDGAAYDPAATYAPGDYLVRAEAAGNEGATCFEEVTITIAQPADIVLTTSFTDVTCHGAADGSITASATGGATITVDGAAYDPAATYAPGDYLVRAEAAGNEGATCFEEVTITIAQPADIVLTTSFTDVTCHGAADGSITASATGGATITVDGAAYDPAATYAPGDYLVRAEAAGNEGATCFEEVTITIAQPADIVLTTSFTDVTCHGAADGSITASATGGATITVDGAAYDPAATYAPGDYLVRAEAAGNEGATCFEEVTITIAQPADIVLTTSFTDVTCHGAADGSITASATGGATITVDGAAYDPAATYAPGDYLVRAEAAGNEGATCFEEVTITIAQPADIVLTTSFTDVTCHGAADGSITASATGGATITVDGAAYDPAATYAPGDYLVRAEAAGNEGATCFEEVTITIAQPADIVLTTSFTDVTCHGAADGSITASATGGATITVDGAAYDPAATYAPGDYLVRAEAAGNEGATCFEEVTITIAQPADIVLTTSFTDVTCHGAADGSITASATGGATITVDGAAYDPAATYAPGDYLVRAEAAGNEGATCFEEVTITIAQPADIVLTTSFTDVTCHGAADGSITASATGGATITVDGAAYDPAATYAPGDYLVRAEAAGNEGATCFEEVTITIAQPADIVLTTSFTDVTCHGAADGSITASATGGATITVDGAAYDPAATYAPGDYLVRAEAAGNEGATCFEEVTITIAQPADIVLTTSFTDVTCHGAADGSITASATGGATITVDGAAYDPAATYAPGDYLVRAEAAGNEGATCFEEVTITIAQPADIVLTTSFTDVTCHGAADGSITASATGGATITVDGAAYDPAATYAPGDYLVRAEAAGNEGATCFEEVTITIAQPADIVLTTSFTDVTCHGAADGSITASATGGATITVDGAAYDPAATYAPGDYLVRAEAAGNEGATCFEEVTITIAQPADIVLTTSFTDVTCHGAADGSITASATGGATITVDGAAYDPAATYAPGDYLVRAEAAGNEGATCFEEVTITIAQPADIVLTTSFTDVTCHGAADGSITASATGGATITVDGAAYDPAATYAPGDYLVRAEAAGNEGATCFEEVTITIAQPADIVLTTSFTDVTCHGAADGSITASATGGATITVDGAAYDPAATYAPGDYLVRAEAAGNEGATCFEEVTITIAQPADIVLTTSFTDVTCHGAADGSITASATGGATITVDGAAYDPAATYAPGDYLVRAEAAGNEGATCFEEVTITIAQPADIVLTTSFTDVTCHGAADGSITASATGGATITVDGAAYDPAATYAPGDYLVRAEAAGNEGATCFEEVTITIAQPADIVLTTSFTDVTCHGAADGSITASATGGATITVDGAAYDPAATYAPGDYLVRAEAAGNEGATCFEEVTITIAQPADIVLTTSFTDVTCHGAADGSITASATGGATITVDGAAYDPAATYAPGDYLVRAEAAGNEGATCFEEVTITIAQPADIVLTTSFTDVTCHGAADGSITASATGGATITVDGAAYDPAATYAPGDYLVRAEAAGNEGATCFEEVTITIAQPEMAVTVQATVTNVSCYGEGGEINVFGLSSGASYIIQLDGTGADLSGQTTFAPGTYVITASAPGGNQGDVCTATVEVVVPDRISIVKEIEHVSCHRGSDGSIDITVTGGTPPYTYVWSSNNFTAYTEDISGLEPSNYQVTVTDANGCTKTRSVNILEPNPLSASTTKVDISCSNSLYGSVDLTVTGGTSPFTFEWSGPGNFSADTEDISDLSEEGTYEVNITDANGCTTSSETTLSQGGSLTINKIREHVSCFGGNDGSVDITVIGGTQPYTYAWIGPGNFSADTEDISGLVAGIYEVHVTDANGCTRARIVTINQPDNDLVGTMTYSDISCNGASDGSIDVTVTGGTQPHTYSWTGPGGFTSSSEDISGLEPGTYELFITDANGCTPSIPCDVTLVVSNNGECCTNINIVGTMEYTDISCPGANDGTIDVTVTGGTAPYSYQWTGPNGFTADTLDISGLAPGTYELDITDANGCVPSVPCDVTLVEPDSGVVLNLKAFLGGPYNVNTGLMNDDLRTNGDLPTSCPYDIATCDASVFNATGNNAIVDWVWVELRDKNSNSTVLASKSALIQRDGDVVSTDGVSPLSFDIDIDDYFVSIAHRNHLGIITVDPVKIISCNLIQVNLTQDTSLIEGGTNAVTVVTNGNCALPAADCDGNGQIQNSDLNGVLPLLGTSSYSFADLDMNGQVQNTDINVLLPNLGLGSQVNRVSGNEEPKIKIIAPRR